MIILDTDVCVALLRGKKHVLERRAKSVVPIKTTVITAGELEYGAEKSRDIASNRALLAAFFTTIEVLEPTKLAAQYFGAIKARLERAGERLHDADLWIASIALHHNATLATGNVRHFKRITELSVEDWINNKP